MVVILKDIQMRQKKLNLCYIQIYLYVPTAKTIEYIQKMF